MGTRRYIPRITPSISTASAVNATRDAPPKPVVVVNDLPGDTMHGWRYLAFGPDGYLYIAMGDGGSGGER